MVRVKKFSGAANLIAEQCWATPVPQPHSDAPDEQSAFHNILLVILKSHIFKTKSQSKSFNTYKGFSIRNSSLKYYDLSLKNIFRAAAQLIQVSKLTPMEIPTKFN